MNLISTFETMFLKLINSWKEIKVIKRANIFDLYNAKKTLLNEIEEDSYGISKYILEILKPL